MGSLESVGSIEKEFWGVELRIGETVGQVANLRRGIVNR